MRRTGVTFSNTNEISSNWLKGPAKDDPSAEPKMNEIRWDGKAIEEWLMLFSLAI